MLEGIGAIVWEADPVTLDFVYVSGAAEEILGYDTERWFTPGFWESILHPEDRKTIVAACRTAISAGKSHTLEYRVQTRSGEVVWLRDVITVRGGDGEPLSVRGVMVDVSDSRSQEAQLRSSEYRYRLLTELSSDYTYCLRLSDKGIEMEWVTEGFTELTGFSKEEIAERGGPESIIHPEDEDVVETALTDLLEHGQGNLDLRVVSKFGRTIWISVHYRVVSDREGTAFIYGAARDITERKELEERLRQSERRFREVAVVDPLTGIRNRRGFATVAEHEFEVAARNRQPLVLLFVDVDGLKAVNDNFGHAEGDNLLQEAASLLTSSFRASDLIARIGGDEFCVLMRAGAETGTELTERFQRAVDAHNAKTTRPYRLRLSIGAAAFDPADPRDVDELMRLADRAMYENRRRLKEDR